MGPEENSKPITPEFLGLLPSIRAEILSYLAPTGDIHVRKQDPGLEIQVGSSYEGVPTTMEMVSRQFREDWLEEFCKNTVFVLSPVSMGRMRKTMAHLMEEWIRQLKIHMRNHRGYKDTEFLFRRIPTVIGKFGALHTVQLVHTPTWKLGDDYIASSVTHRGAFSPPVHRQGKWPVVALTSIKDVLSNEDSTLFEATVLYVPGRIRLVSAKHLAKPEDKEIVVDVGQLLTWRSREPCPPRRPSGNPTH